MKVPYAASSQMRNMIGDEGAHHLAVMPKLDMLNVGGFLCKIGGLKVTNEGGVHLAKLLTLRELDITSNPISNQGIYVISGVTKIHWLNISNMDVMHLQLNSSDGVLLIQEDAYKIENSNKSASDFKMKTELGLYQYFFFFFLHHFWSY